MKISGLAFGLISTLFSASVFADVPEFPSRLLSCEITDASGSFGSKLPPQVGDTTSLDLDEITGNAADRLVFDPAHAARGGAHFISIPGPFQEIFDIEGRRFIASDDHARAELDVISDDGEQVKIWMSYSETVQGGQVLTSGAHLTCSSVPYLEDSSS